MKPKKLGAITLAVSLIALGILVLVSNLVPSFRFTESLKYFIPVVLIALGSEFFIVSAASRRRAKAEGCEEPILQFDGKSIALLFVIIVCLSIYSLVMGIVEHTSRYYRYGSRELDSHSADEDLELLYTGTHEISARNLTTLKGVNPFGDIQILGADTMDISIEYSFRATPSFQERVGTIDDSAFRFQADGDTASFGLSPSIAQAVSSDSSGANDILISYVITIPSNLALDLAQSFGTMEITGCYSAITLDASYSDVYLSDIGGELNLDTSFTDITLDAIHAPSQLVFEYGSLKGSVGAPFSLTSNFSDTDLTVTEKLDGNVSVNSEYGDVTLRLPSDQNGHFAITSSFSSLYCPLWGQDGDSLDSEIQRTVGEGGPEFTLVQAFGDMTIAFE